MISFLLTLRKKSGRLGRSTAAGVCRPQNLSVTVDYNEFLVCLRLKPSHALNEDLNGGAGPARECGYDC
jgi:hypothetical protein